MAAFYSLHFMFGIEMEIKIRIKKTESRDLK